MAIEDIIVELSEEDRLNSHIPEWIYELCHENNVYYRDLESGELIQVLDLK